MVKAVDKKYRIAAELRMVTISPVLVTHWSLNTLNVASHLQLHSRPLYSVNPLLSTSEMEAPALDISTVGRKLGGHDWLFSSHLVQALPAGSQRGLRVSPNQLWHNGEGLCIMGHLWWVWPCLWRSVLGTGERMFARVEQVNQPLARWR